ncbi:MAG: hypothetical protein H6920_09830 [Sphingomonadaceae bacterium]|nr:hypothetical protein [Novosphingobium sp.]MCP5391904.1 hypothetical protein [Sphingomonadaceae bacterium]
MNDFCTPCFLAGGCRTNRVRAVFPADLISELIRDVREFTSKMSREECITDAEWPELLVNWYRDICAKFIDRRGRSVFVDTEALYRRDRKGVILSEEVIKWMDRSDYEGFGEYEDPSHWRTWYRDNLMKPAGKRVRIDNPERWAVVINILKIAYPGPALMWGVRPANDNPPFPVRRPQV